MNPESNDRRDADALDAFWDELVLGRNARHAGNTDEEMVMSLQNSMALDDPSAESRLRSLVFGSAPETTAIAAPTRPVPSAKPDPIRPSWSIRKYGQLAAAALAVILVGALVAAQNAGFFGAGSGDDTPTAIPAAIAQLDATPVALASPTSSTDAILWTLPFDGENVEIGATALAGDTLYRLIRSDDFTSVQAVDTATGTETWRAAQDPSAHGLAADESGVYLAAAPGVVALDAATGEERWSATIQTQAWTLAAGNGHVYVWDGESTLAALDLGDGSLSWQGVAAIDTASGSVRAPQAPVATAGGIAAVSGVGTVVFFDTEGNFTGTAGQLDPESVVLVAAPDDTVAIAGQVHQESTQPWARKLLLASPTSGSTLWETDYSALVTGLTVTDSMAFVLADNPGMAMTEPMEVTVDGTPTILESNPYPEQTSPYIYGYDLETGQMHFDVDESTGTGHGWVADPGGSPYVAIESGPAGPIAISESGQLSFFSTENPLVQAVVSLPGILSNQTATGDSAVYVSLEDGTVTAVAPEFADLQPQQFDLAGNITWAVPITGQLVDFGGMALGEGLVYRLIDTGAGKQIEATYATTGQGSWTVPFDWSTDQIVADPGPSPYESNSTWSGSGNIFVIDSENRLLAIDGARGAIDWQSAFESPVVSMTFDTGSLFIWDESGTMTAFDPIDGTVLWATSIGVSGSQSNEFGNPVPATTSSLVAMVDADGTMHAFDRASGEIVWSTPGFDGTNTRISQQGNAAQDQTEMFVVASAQGDVQADGSFEQNVAGILAESGETLWIDHLSGPLVQPSVTDEMYVVLIGDRAQTGKGVDPSATPIVDAESPRHVVWTDTGPAIDSSVPSGSRLFAIDASNGQIVWIRTSPGPAFTHLIDDEIFGRTQAVTENGLLVSPSGGRGWIDGEPIQLGGPLLAAASSGDLTTGNFATLADGTLVAFGGTPFSQQG